MKLDRFIAIAAVVVFAFAGDYAQPAAKKGTPPADGGSSDIWQKYEFKDDMFRIRFPGRPKVTVDPKDPSGVVLSSRMYELTGPTVIYVAAARFAVDFEKLGKAAEVLEAGKTSGMAAIRNQKPDTYKEENITVQGHPGKSVHVETTDGLAYRYRVIIANDRLYAFCVGFQKANRSAKNIKNDPETMAMAFLDSFEIL
jgi:hypothetical protein